MNNAIRFRSSHANNARFAPFAALVPQDDDAPATEPEARPALESGVQRVAEIDPTMPKMIRKQRKGAGPGMRRAVERAWRAQEYLVELFDAGHVPCLREDGSIELFEGEVAAALRPLVDHLFDSQGIVPVIVSDPTAESGFALVRIPHPHGAATPPGTTPAAPQSAEQAREGAFEEGARAVRKACSAELLNMAASLHAEGYPAMADAFRKASAAIRTRAVGT